MPSVSRISGNAPNLENNRLSSEPELRQNCMKGSTHKRSRTRTRTRTRRSPKKRNKMLPARVARLLGNKPGVVQIAKAAFCISGRDGQIGLLAQGQANTPKSSLCNIEHGAGDRTSSCPVTCGVSLCINNNNNSVERNGLLSRSEPQLSIDAKCSPSGSSASSNRIDRCIAIDCEMVGTGEQGSCSALGRCSIVNYNGDVIYDKYIKPVTPITDYRTPWSGISKEHMEEAMSFYEAKEEILKILKDKIVIGHDVRNDFSVLRLKHPKEDVRDTSRYRGLRHLAGVDGKKRSVSLKVMVERLMGKKIQTGPHCSVEDARATMSLYRLVDGQWEEDTNSIFPDKQFRSSFLDDHFWPDDLENL